MKELKNITEEEVKEICRIVGEPYISFMTNSHGKWASFGLEVQIETTSTLTPGCKYDSSITIDKDGTVALWRNSGDWNGHGYEKINGLLISDYLRKQGYEFEPSKVENYE